MRKPSILTAGLVFMLLASFVSLAQENKESVKDRLKIPPEEAKKQNPVKSTPDSLAAAKKVYGYDCAMCHGVDGDGKGSLADSMNLKLQDLQDPDFIKQFTDGELFYIIVKGAGKMPGEEDRLKPEQVWGLVNYVRTFSKKKPAEKTKEDKP